MMASSSSKSPGRTPPFVLVALVLLVVILGYNYWTMSSSNKTMRELNDKLVIESKDSSEKRLIVEKNLESAREELRVLQGNLDQVKKSLQDKEIELDNVRAEQKKSTDEINQCKDSLAKCDADLQTEKTNVDKITDEKTDLEAKLQEAKNVPKVECGIAECIKPVKDIVGVFTKLVGTDAASTSLKEAGQDVTKLMEGLPRVEPPVQAKPEPVKEVQQAASQNKTNQVSSTLHAASASKIGSENLKFVSDRAVHVNETKLDAHGNDLGPPQNVNNDYLKSGDVTKEQTETTVNEVAPILTTQRPALAEVTTLEEEENFQ